MDTQPTRQFEGALSPQANQGVIAYFHNGTIDDPTASIASGRPIKRTVPFIKIHHVGDRLFTYDQAASNEDIQRFPQQWAQFQAGQQQVPDGTPLSVLFPNDPGTVENLKFHKVFTVEQLAIVNDLGVQSIGMGALSWREKAKAFLSASERGQGLHSFEAKIAKMETDNEAKNQRIAILEAALASKGQDIPDVQPRKRGRPPKAQQE